MAPTVTSSTRLTRRAPTTTTDSKSVRPSSAAGSDTTSKAVAPAKDKNQDRINRKRVQNRISQQCVREKQLAHQKRLEALAEIFKATTESDDASPETRNAMLNNQMSLIEENRDLRDALLRMRKKMLSLSSAVAAVADDPVFEQILQKPKKKKDGQLGIKADPTLPMVEGGQSREVPSSRPLNQNNGITVQNVRSVNDGSAPDLDGMSISNFGNHAGSPHSSPDSSTSTQSIPPADNISRNFSDPAMLGSNSFGFAMEHMVDQNMLLIDDINLGSLNQHNGSWSMFQPDIQANGRFVPHEVNYDYQKYSMMGSNTWKIEQGCIWYISERLGIPDRMVGTHQENRSCYTSITQAISKIESSRALVAEVSKMAVDVMCRTTGTTDYIYGVGANECMEQIFQWRLSPSNRNRLAIMEPFRPTPLQYMSNDYPLSIDFINWPTIRDQLIFKYGTYDYDQLVSDIVANTVIELPEVRAAINIHDTFFTRVWSKAAAASRSETLGKPISEGGFGQWESTARGQHTVGWTSNDIFAFIAQRMQMSECRNLDSRLASDSWNGLVRVESARTAPKQPLATKWGLDSLSRWRLSREFAQAYPFLDCTGVVASYPLYSSKMVPDL